MTFSEVFFIFFSDADATREATRISLKILMKYEVLFRNS
jgi:hypothetical protein